MHILFQSSLTLCASQLHDWNPASLRGEGYGNKEIASDFGLSVRTVENHISHILAKRIFENGFEMARYVVAQQREHLELSALRFN